MKVRSSGVIASEIYEIEDRARASKSSPLIGENFPSRKLLSPRKFIGNRLIRREKEQIYSQSKHASHGKRRSTPDKTFSWRKVSRSETRFVYCSEGVGDCFPLSAIRAVELIDSCLELTLNVTFLLLFVSRTWPRSSTNKSINKYLFSLFPQEEKKNFSRTEKKSKSQSSLFRE